MVDTFSRRFVIAVVVASIALVNLKVNIRQLHSYLPDAFRQTENGSLIVMQPPDQNNNNHLTGHNTTEHESLWRQQRSQHFYDWYEGTNQTDKLLRNADRNGPILDFLIAGFPKCGTTTLEANLGYYAPMPIGDVCTPVHQTVYYAYRNWPKTYGHRRSLPPSNSSSNNNNTQEEKLLRGSKCPRLLETDNDIRDVPLYLPKTKLIVGLRHPVLWFESFWNMHVRNVRYSWMQHLSPYNLTQPCRPGQPCTLGCPTKLNLCLHRANFHLYLARLGKTALRTDAERQWLVQKKDGDDEYPNVPNWNVTNPIFLYEQTTLRDDPVWDSLAQFLGMDSIRHDRTLGNATTKPKRGGGSMIRICDAEYDALRVPLLRSAYAVSRWLLEYLIPVAKNSARPDVVIHNVTEFAQIVQKYQDDPCGRLQRSYDVDGQVQYALEEAVATNDTEAS